MVEALEDRALLALLDIFPSTVNFLSYQVSPGVSNDLTIALGTAGGTTSYRFTDATDPITLGEGAQSLGWTAIDANTVTGPASSVGSMTIDTGDGADTINIDSTNAPVSINPAAAGNRAINIGNGSLGGVAGDVDIVPFTGTTPSR